MHSSDNISLPIPTMLFSLHRYDKDPHLITTVVLRAAAIVPRVKAACKQHGFPVELAESVITVDQRVRSAVEAGTLPQLLAKCVMYYDLHKLSVSLGANDPCVEIHLHQLLTNQLVSNDGGLVSTAFLYTALEWQRAHNQSRRGWVSHTTFEYLIQFDA